MLLLLTMRSNNFSVSLSLEMDVKFLSSFESPHYNGKEKRIRKKAHKKRSGMKKALYFDVKATKVGIYIRA